MNSTHSKSMSEYCLEFQDYTKRNLIPHAFSSILKQRHLILFLRLSLNHKEKLDLVTFFKIMLILLDKLQNYHLSLRAIISARLETFQSAFSYLFCSLLRDYKKIKHVHVLWSLPASPICYSALINNDNIRPASLKRDVKKITLMNCK